jgi:hypothetical protein
VIALGARSTCGTAARVSSPCPAERHPENGLGDGLEPSSFWPMPMPTRKRADGTNPTRRGRHPLPPRAWDSDEVVPLVDPSDRENSSPGQPF